jgi:diguanylate cyclase (GGDEF)-like protein
MSPSRRPAAAAEALRLAHRAWRLLHLDSALAIHLAERALALALASGDAGAQGWSHLPRGYHLLYFATPAEAMAELTRALRCFEASGDRAGQILTIAGTARAMWREGRFSEAIERVLPVRDEGLRVLKHEQRGVLLNTIAGCYSARGESEQAFAYMYEALRDAGPSRGHGFDAVLHCNLAHELLQIGDHHEALRCIDRGIERCAGLKNPRLLCVLLINRIVCLIELGRTAEALPDIARVRALPADASGRGTVAPAFETLAIAALRAGDAALGRELVVSACSALRSALPDEQIELAIASALCARERGELDVALDELLRAQPLAHGTRERAGRGAEGTSLRVRCQFYLTLGDLHEARGDTAGALAALRVWQQLQVARADLASRARYQSAALQTELLRLQQRLDEKDAQRRATERARAELEAANQQLSRTVDEVQALQEALRQQATRDALTGLFNRRHLNETLPAMFALARRDRQPLALALIDLDHFKQINDRHGHGVGDRLLAAFGALLVDGCRKSDVACRYGGEEFCLLMPRSEAAAARRKVQALLRRWRSERFEIDGCTLAGLSFSAGVADSLRVPQSGDMLLRAADDELLVAKRQGRNRVRAAESLAVDCL